MMQMMSGVVATTSPSCQAAANSFWNSSFSIEPRSPSSPSSRELPRKKLSVVRRSMSCTLPLNSTRPGSASTSRGDRVVAAAARLVHGAADADRPAGAVEDAVLLDLGAGAGPRQVAETAPISPSTLRAIRLIHCGSAARGMITSVSRMSAIASGSAGRPAMAKLIIWASGKARTHRIGIDHGQAGHRRDHQRLQGVGAADLDRHHGAEPAVEMALQRQHRLGREARVRQPLAADQRRADAGDDRHRVVVGQLFRIQQRDARALPRTGLQIEQRQVGIAAAAGAENPGAGRQRFELVAFDRAHWLP